jgi:DNA mismatch repair protein MLH3
LFKKYPLVETLISQSLQYSGFNTIKPNYKLLKNPLSEGFWGSLPATDNAPFLNTRAIDSFVDSNSATTTKLSFTKEMLKSIVVIGQVSRKFVVCSLLVRKKSKCIVVVDPHAAEERINVEKLTKDYMVSIKTLVDVGCINLSTTSTIQLAKAPKLKQYGIQLGVRHQQSNGKPIVSLKICTFLYDALDIKSLSDFIQRCLCWIESEISASIPLPIQELLNTKACRSAVKLGTELSLDDCKKLIENLGYCEFPFQCAHGRPLLVPLVSIYNADCS